MLVDHGYDGPLHFDAHAYRTEDYQGVKDFARGCMKTYMLLKQKVARFNADREIQALLKQIHVRDEKLENWSATYTVDAVRQLKAYKFNRTGLGARGIPYEKLDQMTMEIIMGER